MEGFIINLKPGQCPGFFIYIITKLILSFPLHFTHANANLRYA